jgi:hypothetical protein
MRFWGIRNFRAKCPFEIFNFLRRKLMSLAGWGESNHVASGKVTLDPISEFVRFPRSVALLPCIHAWDKVLVVKARRSPDCWVVGRGFCQDCISGDKPAKFSSKMRRFTTDSWKERNWFHSFGGLA